jgi:hypothetical protein
MVRSPLVHAAPWVSKLCALETGSIFLREFQKRNTGSWSERYSMSHTGFRRHGQEVIEQSACLPKTQKPHILAEVGNSKKLRLESKVKIFVGDELVKKTWVERITFD